MQNILATMTRRHWILLATGGSAALMLGALAFQYIGGYPPCKMCYWQRYPHVIAVVIGAVALVWPMRAILGFGALAAFSTGAIGLYHAGVEQGWFEGPTTCTSSSIKDMSSEDLLNQIMAAPLIRCDDIAWEFLGLSMAGWNGLLSLALCGAWLVAATRAR